MIFDLFCIKTGHRSYPKGDFFIIVLTRWFGFLAMMIHRTLPMTTKPKKIAVLLENQASSQALLFLFPTPWANGIPLCFKVFLLAYLIGLQIYLQNQKLKVHSHSVYLEIRHTLLIHHQ